MKIDISPSKNNHLVQFKKTKIDQVKNAEQAKEMAKKELDTIRRIHKNNSLNASCQLLAVVLLIGIQIGLYGKGNTKN